MPEVGVSTPVSALCMLSSVVLVQVSAAGSVSLCSTMWDAEETAMQLNRTLNIDMCRRRGVGESYLREWQFGVLLDGHEEAGRFDLEDYQSVVFGMERAAEEIDRLTEAGKIFWFQ